MSVSATIAQISFLILNKVLKSCYDVGSYFVQQVKILLFLTKFSSFWYNLHPKIF